MLTKISLGLELIDCRHNRLCYLPPTLKSLNFLEKIDLGDNPIFPLPQELTNKKTLIIDQESAKTQGRFVVARADMKGDPIVLHIIEANSCTIPLLIQNV